MWRGLEPVTRDLHHLAHTSAGVRDERELSKQEAFLAHPAVRQGWLDHPEKPRRAVERVLADARRLGGGLALTPSELTAVQVLLFARQSVAVHGTDHVLTGDHVERARLAGELLGRGKFRDRDSPAGEPPSSPESRLLGMFVGALDRLDAPAPVTGALGWTPPGPPIVVPVADVADLCGTWTGVTDSAWLLKEPGPAKSGTFPCVMSVVQDTAGAVEIFWFYPAGTARAVAVRVAGDATGRRLVVVYESTTSFAADPGRPTHRGAALLDVDTTPAGRIAGPYWTDRGTSGTLAFTERAVVAVRSHAEAAVLLGQRRLS